MAGFLKAVSAIYLIFVWLIVAGAIAIPKSGVAAAAGNEATGAIAIFLGVLLSIPAVALYAFGQVVEDVRSMRNHLHAMRRYYEPDVPHADFRT